MSSKRISISAHHLADPQAKAWIRQGAAVDSGKVEHYKSTADVGRDAGTAHW